MGDELHSLGDDADPAPSSSASERAKRGAATRKQKREAREKRQREAAERRAARAQQKPAGEPAAAETASSGPEAEQDEAWSKWVQEEMERPCSSPKELALVLGRLQMGLHAMAQDSDYAEAVMALQWTTGVAPTPHCLTGCRMMWPFFKKHDLFVLLAEQADAILAAIGAFILVAPAAGPAWKVFKANRAKKAAEEQQQQSKATEAGGTDGKVIEMNRGGAT
jgi:hypothetical protein